MNLEATVLSSFSPASTEQAVWQFLVEHRDPDNDDAPAAVVSRVRQEEIAQNLSLPLGHVIEAIRRLQRRGRLRAERQAVGQPFRYCLEAAATQEALAHAA